VESHGFKSVKDARKEFVVQIERELGELKNVIQALGVGEEEEKVEEKVEETMGEEQVEKAVVEEVHMEYFPSVAPVEVPGAPGASALEGEHGKSSHPQAELVLGTDANTNIQ